MALIIGKRRGNSGNYSLKRKMNMKILSINGINDMLAKKDILKDSFPGP